MRTDPVFNYNTQQKQLLNRFSSLISEVRETGSTNVTIGSAPDLPEILVITPYPPRECGIGFYSQHLITALTAKFGTSFTIKVCALENEHEKHTFSADEVITTLDTSCSEAYLKLAATINRDNRTQLVVIQHDFELFDKHQHAFQLLLDTLVKPVIVVFHTVLPKPDLLLKLRVQHIVNSCESIIVMTSHSEQVLINDYALSPKKITVIPHGTHLVPHLSRAELKEKYNLSDRKVLSTFGLLGQRKSIETVLQALPHIIKNDPSVLFLVIGKTHPSVIRQEGETYRNTLQTSVKALGLQHNVQFINAYLPLPDLLDYLYLTDIYLSMSKDPGQAVSGTLSYALSCGCAIISTPIPQAKEILSDGIGIIVDFEQPKLLTEAIGKLLAEEDLRRDMGLKGLTKIASTVWENTAIAHATLFEKVADNKISLKFSAPVINLDHIKLLTTDFGIIQCSKNSQPELSSGYTLNDNARALIAMCHHYELTKNEDDIKYITIYLNFIKHCLQTEGYFLNHVNSRKNFTAQNNATNLADANGKAFWALGYLISKNDCLPQPLVQQAEETMKQAIFRLNSMHSTRAIAFAIKGLYYFNSKKPTAKHTALIKTFANRLVQMYRHESDGKWQWFENYLTHSNSILPEALLCAYIETGDVTYKTIAKTTFDFLLSKTFTATQIKVISNKSWLHKGGKSEYVGEQPIDVAYTIIALHKFYTVFNEEKYSEKITMAFNWFLGNNQLQQIIYNPFTGGCYNGIEEKQVNLNQGAESTVSYLMARLIIEQQLNNKQEHKAAHLKLEYID